MSQFADDLGLWTSDKKPIVVERRLKHVIDNLETWCSKWRIKLNARKTQLIIFQKRNKHPPITVELFDERIPRTEQATLLGITYDSKFTFETFLQKLTTKFIKKLTLMYKLRGTNWGANPHTLTKLYKAYIRPTLEYAAPILLCLTKTRKKRLQILQNKALIMALQAHHRAHIQTLHDQTNTELIETRLEYIAK